MIDDKIEIEYGSSITCDLPRLDTDTKRPRRCKDLFKVINYVIPPIAGVMGVAGSSMSVHKTIESYLAHVINRDDDRPIVDGVTIAGTVLNGLQVFSYDMDDTKGLLGYIEDLIYGDLTTKERLDLSLTLITSGLMGALAAYANFIFTSQFLDDKISDEIIKNILATCSAISTSITETRGDAKLILPVIERLTSAISQSLSGELNIKHKISKNLTSKNACKFLTKGYKNPTIIAIATIVGANTVGTIKFIWDHNLEVFVRVMSVVNSIPRAKLSFDRYKSFFTKGSNNKVVRKHSLKSKIKSSSSLATKSIVYGSIVYTGMSAIGSIINACVPSMGLTGLKASLNDTFSSENNITLDDGSSSSSDQILILLILTAFFGALSYLKATDTISDMNNTILTKLLKLSDPETGNKDQATQTRSLTNDDQEVVLNTFTNHSYSREPRRHTMIHEINECSEDEDNTGQTTAMIHSIYVEDIGNNEQSDITSIVEDIMNTILDNIDSDEIIKSIVDEVTEQN